MLKRGRKRLSRACPAISNDPAHALLSLIVDGALLRQDTFSFTHYVCNPWSSSVRLVSPACLVLYQAAAMPRRSCLASVLP